MFKKSLVSLLLLLMVVPLIGQRCTFLSGEERQALQPIVLDYWRVTDTPDDFDQIIAAYNQQHPNISINVRVFRMEEYEQELLEALAEDRGPDMISIHNTWVRKHENKIAPLPPSLDIAFLEVRRTLLKTETIVDIRSVPSITLKQLREQFVDVVDSDVVINDQIYGLPLSVDSLAMYYNRDLLNQAGIPLPPRNWNQFQGNVQSITQRGAGNDIIVAGGAIGTADNIERSPDLLAILMMQNGTEMVDINNRATFDVLPRALAGRSQLPSVGALQFYIDFASPNKEVYTWNNSQPNSLEAFIQGNTGFFFGYSWHLPLIRAQGPRLNFGIANLPQIVENSPVNYASYWVETVSKKSDHVEEAWDFIQFASSPQNVGSYLERTNKPTALLSLIDAQRQSEDLDVFGQQVLTAKSWYRGNDAAAVDNIFEEMINLAFQATSPEDLTSIVRAGAQKVNQTY